MFDEDIDLESMMEILEMERDYHREIQMLDMIDELLADMPEKIIQIGGE